MQRSTKSELQMLRELAWFILPFCECHFCHEPILGGPQGGMSFGHRRHPGFVDMKLTVHHMNKDRDDNSRLGPRISGSTGLIWIDGNLRLVHKRCHVAYHANERRMNEPNGDVDPD